MDKLKWYKNPEMIVALSALLIGVVTAFTSMYSAYVDRQYARSSVWPRLDILRSFHGDLFSYVITNNGTGPALIKYAKVKNGSEYIKRWSDVEQFKQFTQSHIGSRTLSPQSTITPLFYQGDNVKLLASADDSISIELCYCSIYEECWLIDRANHPQVIEHCETDDNQVFLE